VPYTFVKLIHLYNIAILLLVKALFCSPHPCCLVIGRNNTMTRGGGIKMVMQVRSSRLEQQRPANTSVTIIAIPGCKLNNFSRYRFAAIANKIENVYPGISIAKEVYTFKVLIISTFCCQYGRYNVQSRGGGGNKMATFRYWTSNRVIGREQNGDGNR
jgi:hypothetical protein